MQTIFAGACSVPVVAQALAILSREQLPTLNDENIDQVPPEAIVLAATGLNARFPSRFLRRLPADSSARLRELTERQLEIPSSVLEIPNLVLVRPCRHTNDGTYTGKDLLPFTLSLLQLAGRPKPKVRRNRGRRAGRVSGHGLQPYLVH